MHLHARLTMYALLTEAESDFRSLIDAQIGQGSLVKLRLCLVQVIFEKEELAVVESKRGMIGLQLDGRVVR